MSSPLKQPPQPPVGAATARSRRRLWRTVRPLLLVTSVLVGLYLTGLLLISLLSLDQLHSMKQGLTTFGAWWIIARLSFIAGLAIYWVEINTWLSHRNQWSAAHLARVIAGRWLAVGVLSVVELFLVQRIHEPLIDRWIG